MSPAGWPPWSNFKLRRVNIPQSLLLQHVTTTNTTTWLYRVTFRVFIFYSLEKYLLFSRLVSVVEMMINGRQIPPTNARSGRVLFTQCPILALEREGTRIKRPLIRRTRCPQYNICAIDKNTQRNTVAAALVLLLLLLLIWKAATDRHELIQHHRW